MAPLVVAMLLIEAIGTYAGFYFLGGPPRFWNRCINFADLNLSFSD
jgi:hypothetical protein